MNSYSKLAKNSIIFAMGNLGTKLIALILVPFYTYFLTTNQYGTTDIITTTISLLLPIATLSIFDAVLRFAMDTNYDKSSIVNNSILIGSIGFVLCLLLYPFLIRIKAFSNYLTYFYMILLVQVFNSIVSQFSRAIGQIKLFALSGIINSIVLVVSNILLLAVIEMGIKGYLISIIFSNTISMLFLIIYGKLYKYMTLRTFDKNLAREMIIYSMPLIPNAVMWWVMGVSDRYAITFFIGLEANGLYAVANKIPSLLSIINSIFFQAWQISAIEEAQSSEKSKFYTNVFNIFSTVMLLSTSLILIALKFIMKFLVSEAFYISWEYVPFLLLGVIFSSFSGFLGTNYIALKKTNGVFKTSVVGAVANIILNIILIPNVGINGAGIATAISFAIVWIIRIYDTKEFVNIEVNVNKLVLILIIILMQSGILYMNFKFELIIEVILLMILLYINKFEIMSISDKVREKYSKRL